MKTITRFLVVSLALVTSVPNVLAQVTPRTDLAFASLEDLLKIEVTSAGRKEQSLDRVPAAVFVVTQEDIRRSGATALAEVLRLVPGVQIARQNSGGWALTVRGFNGPTVNKLLVLIDGRSIYNRGNSGVFWAAEDLLLDDIDRIEVVRGPGGAVWGANAVNGVIDIITKSSTDTTGVLVRAGDSMFDGQQAAVRVGQAKGDTAYRVSTQWSQHDSSRLAPGVSAHDDWHMFSTAGRVDSHRGQNAWLMEGTFTKSNSPPLGVGIAGPTDFQPSAHQQYNWLRGSLLARWTHTYSGGASLKVQSFYNFNQNHHTPDALAFVDTEHIADMDATLHVGLGRRHDLVVGGGYRHLIDASTSSFAFSINPARDVANVSNVFAQDEIAIGGRVHVTLGSKLEHETMTGWGVEPTARIMWDLGRSQHVWAAFSRALRAPAPFDRNAVVHFAAIPGQNGVPQVFGIIGNPAYQSERFRDLETGYRVALGPQVSIDVTAFRGHYDGLPTNEPVAPRFEATPASAYVFIPVQLANLMQADTTGAELAVRWIPTNTFSVDGSYSRYQLAAHVDPSSLDVTSGPATQDAPANQWQLHSALAPWRGAELSGALYHVSALRLSGVPAYTRADARFELKVTPRLSAIVSGQNLLQAVHAEAAGNSPATISTLVPRSGSLQLMWRF